MAPPLRLRGPKTKSASLHPQRGNHFADTSTRARQTIAELGARFVRSGSRVLVHGHSRVVLALLRLAVEQGIQFDVIVTEGRVSQGVGLRLSGFWGWKSAKKLGIKFDVIVTESR